MSICQKYKGLKMSINEVETTAQTIALYVGGIVQRKEFIVTPHNMYIVVGDITDEDIDDFKLFVESNNIVPLFVTKNYYNIDDELLIESNVLDAFKNTDIQMVQELATNEPEYVYFKDGKVFDITGLRVNVI